MSTNAELIKRAEELVQQVSSDKEEIKKLVKKLEDVQAPAIQKSKDDMKNILTSMGVDINDDTPLSDYAEQIKTISGIKFYKCASVDTVNKTWTGYKAVLENGFYTITDEQKTLEYGSFTPEVGKVYPEEMTGIFTPFKDPSLVPVINDQNTVFLIYPGASEGRVENIGMGKDACIGDFTCDMTVENNKLKSGGKLTLPAGYLPVNALHPATEWTLDIWFDLDLENLGEGTEAVLSSNDYSYSDIRVESGKNGSFRFYGLTKGSIAGLTLSTLEYPATPRRITLEQWSDNGTMQISVYIDGKCIYSAANTVNDKFTGYGVVFPGRRDMDTWFSGHYAMISVRTAADHKGQSFEIKNNPYS